LNFYKQKKQFLKVAWLKENRKKPNTSCNNISLTYTYTKGSWDW